MPQYQFEKWSDGVVDNPRQINLIVDTTLLAIYKEVSVLPTFTFDGQVLIDRTTPPTEGETVTIDITLPDNTTAQVTALTQSDGTFNATYDTAQIGTYSAKASVAETAEHLAGESASVTFEITPAKPSVTITLTVTPQSQPA